jgi:protein SCO1/2
MTQSQKILSVGLWGLIVIAMVALIASGVSPRNRDHADHVQVTQTALPEFTPGEFSLTNQEGKTITTSDLKGHPWIADFIFTRCPGPCPLMTAKLASLQSQIPSTVKFVSFTVDPKNDTPAVLKGYADKFNADPSRWHFLTGERTAIINIAANLKLTAQGQSPQDFIHDEHFVLIDSSGKVRNYYESTDKQKLDQLVADAKSLP